MINLTYYHKKGTPPFSSLSALTDKEAVLIMDELYKNNADDAIWGRFKNPVQYLHDRRETEEWLIRKFISKGGCPQEEYPIYMMSDVCDFIEDKMLDENLLKIQLSLAKFGENDICFTFFDSMFSYILGRGKSSHYYQAKYHGKPAIRPLRSCLYDGDYLQVLEAIDAIGFISYMMISMIGMDGFVMKTRKMS